MGTRRREEPCKVCECFTGGGARVVVARPGRRFSWEDVFCSEGNFVSKKPIKLNRNDLQCWCTNGARPGIYRDVGV